MSKNPFPGNVLSGKVFFIMKYGGANLEKYGDDILRMRIIMWESAKEQAKIKRKK